MDSPSGLLQKIDACSIVNSDIIARLEAFDEEDVVITSFCISKIVLDLESEKSPTVMFPKSKTTKNICKQIKDWNASTFNSLSFTNFFRHDLERDISNFEDVKWAQSELKDLTEKYKMLKEDQLVTFLGELRMILSKLEEVQVLLGEIESLTIGVKSPIIDDSKKSEVGNLISKALECLDIDPSHPESEWRLCRVNKTTKASFNDLEENERYLLHFLTNIITDGGHIDWNNGMFHAAKGGKMELVKFFIKKGAYNWNRGMFYAAEGGQMDLVEFFIGKGADDWNKGMFHAAEGGQMELVEFFIEKGANNWDWGMECAAEEGELDLVKFFIKKGADDWNRGMHGAAEGGQMDLVKFFIEKGADDWNRGMCGAAEGGQMDLVKFFIEKGADDWNRGMECAAEEGELDLVEFFIEKGADREVNWLFELEVLSPQ